MTRRDLIIAGASAAAVLLVGGGVVAAVWPSSDSPTPSADSSIPSVPPAPTITSLEPTGPSSDSPSDTPSSSSSPENEEEEEGNGKRKPEDAPLLADAPAPGKGPLPSSSPVSCPAATVTVSDTNGLTEALKNAAPGTSIALSDGKYAGKFVAEASGTAEQPVWLCGGAGAVLDGENIKGGYVFHLKKAKYWRLVGFTVTNGQKGVMADTTVGTVVQALTVHDIGDEAIHLRSNSTDNVVRDNTISKTGLRREKFGEGVYIGSAVSNWCTSNDCKPDRSDRNVVRDNKISQTTSEAVDIKEGTTGGLLEGNTFDGSALSGADSWVDVKGNNWLIKGNTGTKSTTDGFQTHQILKGWGDHNLFTGNTAAVDGPGFGFALRPTEANVVACDNKVTGAGEGLSNIPCR
ncbi:parallel beta helix pectate lyase-like protein [Kribbella sp. VKM Ac-2527]|uniref:Parallel beta helix pectate lyase-like protein n=1 Tax=Kribbella caucasensis TaxID=2512215 RepID=A0A4V3C6M8_9ACTN|nr:right-handed parallel beta-helix repeat-containing protein [Kribbella sp. VKM Ac-2527]TDO34388.1 parallel beta helix pectate lyase-like protein [Kribbella sp. VKM Ac-2527]